MCNVRFKTKVDDLFTYGAVVTDGNSILDLYGADERCHGGQLHSVGR